MRARHRLSKLLLRQGIVYSGGQAWTGAHDAWLRRQRFDNPGTTMAFESDYEAVLAVTARRDRLDKAIAQLAADSEFTPIVRRLGCLRGIVDADRVRARRRDRRLAPVHRQQHRLVRRPGPVRALLRRSRVQGSITKTGNTHARRLLVEAAWHHRARYRPGKTMRDRWELAPPPPGPAVTPATGACTSAGSRSTCAANDRSSPTSPSPANSPAGAGPWPSWTNRTTDRFVAADGGSSAWSDPRLNYEQPTPGRRRSTLDTRCSSCRTARPAVTNPRISV